MSAGYRWRTSRRQGATPGRLRPPTGPVRRRHSRRDRWRVRAPSPAAKAPRHQGPQRDSACHESDDSMLDAPVRGFRCAVWQRVSVGRVSPLLGGYPLVRMSWGPGRGGPWADVPARGRPPERAPAGRGSRSGRPPARGQRPPRTGIRPRPRVAGATGSRRAGVPGDGRRPFRSRPEAGAGRQPPRGGRRPERPGCGRPSGSPRAGVRRRPAGR